MPLHVGASVRLGLGLFFTHRRQPASFFMLDLSTAAIIKLFCVDTCYFWNSWPRQTCSFATFSSYLTHSLTFRRLSIWYWRFVRAQDIVVDCFLPWVVIIRNVAMLYAVHLFAVRGCCQCLARHHEVHCRECVSIFHHDFLMLFWCPQGTFRSRYWAITWGTCEL